MARDLLVQTFRPALWGALGLSAGLGVIGHWPAASGFLAGAAWNVANLALLQRLAHALAQQHRRRVWTWVLVKLGVLYPVGLAVALSRWCSLIGMVAGFSWVFLVLVGRALVATAGPRLPSEEGGSLSSRSLGLAGRTPRQFALQQGAPPS